MAVVRAESAKGSCMSMPRISFTVISEALRGQQFAFDGEQPISIGRTPENALALDHKSVSRRHARVDADGGGFVLHDLGSHNGTRVGDKLVSKHTLQPGDVIGLGEILLQFAPLDAAGAAVPPPPVSSALPAIAGIIHRAVGNCNHPDSESLDATAADTTSAAVRV